MASNRRLTELLGRRAECGVLDDLVAAAREGRSAAIVVRGEPGIGKTALLHYLAERSDDCRVLRIAGIQAEAELSYAALHQLCAPLLDGLSALPAPQEEALSVAFGLRTGEAPGRFLVGLAALSLLANAGAGRPLVCTIDDAQWLDVVSRQTLEFVARRLHAESVVLAFAVREPHHAELLTGVGALHLKGLDDAEARVLLDSTLAGPLDEDLRDRLVAECAGNPLALLELPRGMTAGASAGGFATPDELPAAGQVEEEFVARVRSLDADARLLVLTAAADPLGDVGLVRRAGERMGIDIQAATTNAETSGLIRLGLRVKFRHPLVRSATYRSAPETERRTVHRALADTMDPNTDPERRVWHLSRAAAGPDEDIAAELVRSADLARARGGVAAEAAFLQRAAELTPDLSKRGPRTLAAAVAKSRAGALNEAMALADVAQSCDLDDLALARLAWLRGHVLFVADDVGPALAFLLEAGKRFETIDVESAIATYRKAMHLTLLTGELETGGSIDVARAVLGAPRPADPVATTKLIEGVARVVADGYSVGAPLLVRALTAYQASPEQLQRDLGWLGFACRCAVDAWDFASLSKLTALNVEGARALGDVSKLPTALQYRMHASILAANLKEAAHLFAEARAIGDVVGLEYPGPTCALILESVRGDEAAMSRALAVIDGYDPSETEIAFCQWTLAVLYNGLGRHDEAFLAAQRACDTPEGLGVSIRSTVELVEAGAGTGRRDEVRDAVNRVVEMAEATGSAWAESSAFRVRALVADDEWDSLFRAAIDGLERLGVHMEVARTQLCYGEALRRAGRRTEARDQLLPAYGLFRECGAEGFAARTRRELAAVGSTVRTSGPALDHHLTPQEDEIARLAAEGLTNPEIGARLFLSRHTVEWHLRKVYVKLGIGSRRDIARALEST
jgi:DNA-binding CsgD family transcriptional regulator